MNVNYLRGKLMAEIDILRVKGQLSPELEKNKYDDFKSKTGFTFTPSEAVNRVSSTETNSTLTENRKASTSPDKINSKAASSSNGRTIFFICESTTSSDREQKSECDNIFSLESDVEIFSNNSFRYSNEYSATSTVEQSHSFCDPLHTILKKNINQNEKKDTGSPEANGTKERRESLVADLYWSDSSSEHMSTSSQEKLADSFMSIALIDEDEFFLHLSNKQGILTSTPKHNSNDNSCLESPNNQCENLRAETYGLLTSHTNSLQKSADSECISISKKPRIDVEDSFASDSQTFKSIAETSISSEYRRTVEINKTNYESAIEFSCFTASKDLLSNDASSYVDCEVGPITNESQLNVASSIKKLLPDTLDSKPSPMFVKKRIWRPPFKRELNN